MQPKVKSRATGKVHRVNRYEMGYVFVTGERPMVPGMDCDWYSQEAEDYKEVLADKDRIIKEMDVFINGDNAAEAPALIDVFASVRDLMAQVTVDKLLIEQLIKEKAELRVQLDAQLNRNPNW